MFNNIDAMRALGRRSRVGGEHGCRGEQCDAREAQRPNVDELSEFRHGAQARHQFQTSLSRT